MKSRTSFFNKTVLRKDITRFLPAWIVYCVFFLLEVNGYAEAVGGSLQYLASDMCHKVAITALFALAAGLCVFGDLHNSRLCNGLHALPIRRESWFATHMLAAFLFWLVPHTIRALIAMPTMGNSWFVGILYLLGMSAQYLFFLSLVAVCVMCTGTRLATTVMYGVVNFGSMLCYWYIFSFYNPLLPGVVFPEDSFELFCPIAHIMNTKPFRMTYGVNLYLYRGLSSDWWYYGALALLAVAFTALAVVLYRRRKLEAAGEFVVLRPLKLVLWLLMTLVCGAIGRTLLTSEVSLLLSLLLGGMLMEVLMTRSSKHILKGLGKGAIIAGVVMVTLILTNLDPLNVVHRIPEQEQVRSVVIEYPVYDFLFGSRGESTLTEPDSIQKAIEAHSLLLEDMDTNTSTNSWIQITYKLKNGTEMSRAYEYSTRSDSGAAIKELLSCPELVLGYHDWDAFLEENSTIYVANIQKRIPLPSKLSKELLEAVRADCLNETWESASDGNDIWFTIYLSDGETILITSGSTLSYAWCKENLPALFR